MKKYVEAIGFKSIWMWNSSQENHQLVM